MKKFYSTMVALIAALAVSASTMPFATVPQNGKLEFGEKSKPALTAKKELTATGKVASGVTIKPLDKLQTKKVGAMTMEELYGEYEWNFYDALNNNESYEEVSFMSTDVLSGDDEYEDNEFAIVGLYGSVLVAAYDVATGTITINPTIVGYNEEYSEYIMFTKCNEQTLADDPDKYEVVPDFQTPFTLELSTLNSGETAWASTDYYGFSGVIFDIDANGQITGMYPTYDEGYYSLYQVAIIMDSPWEEYGECTWIDGIGAAMYGGESDPEKSIITTKLYYVPGNKYPAYRIASPFAGSLGISGGSLEFYIISPELCYVPVQETPIYDSVSGQAFVGSFAWNMNVGTGENSTDEEYIAAYKTSQYAEYVITATESDGTMIVNFAPNSVGFVWPYADPDTSGTNPNAMYRSSAPLMSVLEFKIKSNSVESIIGDINENAPVEYYNLQGIRVNEPAKGQLVIKRQGNKAVKVVK